VSKDEDQEDEFDEEDFDDDDPAIQESIADLMNKTIEFLDGHEFTDPKAAKAAAILQGEFQFALRHWFEPVDGDGDEDETEDEAGDEDEQSEPDESEGEE